MDIGGMACTAAESELDVLRRVLEVIEVVEGAVEGDRERDEAREAGVGRTTAVT